MRKLASIQRISEIRPIENADAIELAKILGWQVVVKKGEFQPGDLCVYCEIDSLLPERSEFEFLRNKKFRIKTVRLRGQLSQGICFSLTVLPTGDRVAGDDITEELGVKKYEPPIPTSMGGLAKGVFPGHVSKTDETRIQAFPELLEEFSGLRCYSTVKIDGTSASFIHCNGEVDVCSRNLSFRETESSIYWRMYHKYHVGEVLQQAGNFAIQGEIAGPGIQKNPLGLKELELFVFNVFNIDEARYLDFDDFVAFCATHDLQTVLVNKVDFVFDYTIEQLLELAKGKYHSGHRREGIVIRPIEEKVSQILGGRLSCKVINNDFLLKKKD